MLAKLKKRAGLVVLGAYGLFLLLWLAQAVFFFVGDHARTERTLPLSGAALENLVLQPDGSYLSMGIDPQLVFDGLDEKVRLVKLEATFERAPGEMELFYAQKPGQGFWQGRRVIGVPGVDGSVLYALPPGRYAALRLDAGTAGDNRIAITAVTLNPRLPAAHYFVPSLRTVGAFLLVPALACCVFYTIIEVLQKLPKNPARRAKKAPRETE
ncbi:MAG: hypothetical protein AB7V55_00185 [Oscillospiraceae bacterium]